MWGMGIATGAAQGAKAGGGARQVASKRRVRQGPGSPDDLRYAEISSGAFHRPYDLGAALPQRCTGGTVDTFRRRHVPHACTYCTLAQYQ